MNYPNINYPFFPNQQFNPQPIQMDRFAPNMNNANNNQFVFVQSENEVIDYPIALGNSITFKHQTEPFIYIKTMGLSQFDKPKIVKYKLTEEELGSQKVQPNNSTPVDPKWLNEDDLKPVLDEIQIVKHEIEDIKKRIDEINNASKPSKTTTTKEK